MKGVAFDVLAHTYYPNGNLHERIDMTRQRVETFKYDDLDRLTFQRRVQKSMASGGTVFVAGLYERRDRDGSIDHVFYVPGELGPAAEVHFNETTKQETTRFLHEDALGSVRVVTDEGGAPVGKTMFFEPFGQRVQEDGSAIPANFTPPVDLGFTGHNHDDDVGLIDMRGRVFDPAIRRFLTPDPYVPRPLFGQSYNRYAYTDNNPVNFRDPSGFTGLENKPVLSGELGNRVTAISAPAFLRQIFGKSAASTSAPNAKGTTPSPNAAKSDSQGIGEPTGAMSPASRAPTPASVPESQVLGSAQVSADGEGDSEGDLEAESWKDNTAVQAIGGFAAGVALGVVPFGGLDWPSSDFAAVWKMHWDNATLEINSQWRSVVGSTESLLAARPTLTIENGAFISEWKQVLGVALKALTEAGYRETQLTDMARLQKIYCGIPESGILYRQQ